MTVDVRTLREARHDTQGLLVVGEDHYPEGGIATPVLEEGYEDAQQSRVAHCAVRSPPSSGPRGELMAAVGFQQTTSLRPPGEWCLIGDSPIRRDGGWKSTALWLTLVTEG